MSRQAAPPDTFVNPDRPHPKAPYWTRTVSCIHPLGSARDRLTASPCAFTSAGNVKTISGQFRKADLCAEHRLNVSSRSPPHPRVADPSGGSPVIYARLIPGSPTSCPRSWCERKRSLYVFSLLVCRVGPPAAPFRASAYPASPGQHTSRSRPCKSRCRPAVRHLWLRRFPPAFGFCVPFGSEHITSGAPSLSNTRRHVAQFAGKDIRPPL